MQSSSRPARRWTWLLLLGLGLLLLLYGLSGLWSSYVHFSDPVMQGARLLLPVVRASPTP